MQGDEVASGSKELREGPKNPAFPMFLVGPNRAA